MKLRIPPSSIEILEARIAPAFGAVFDVSSLNGSNGVALEGVAEYEQSGDSVSDAGDVNGDGFGDVIVSSDPGDPNRPAASVSYVVFGRADLSATAGHLSLGSLNGTNGFRLRGYSNDEDRGLSVSAAGDINGDGFDDVIIGALDRPNGSASGVSYVVFGRADFSATAGRLDLSTLNGANGVRLNGVAAGDYSGTSVSGAGDVNGDGFDDVIIGARGADPNGLQSGASYVVFGRADFSSTAGDLELSSLNGANGFRLNGAAAFDYAGWSVSGAGDVNGDGLDDVIIGAWRAAPSGDSSGASYVIFGRADFSPTAGNLNLASLNGANGFRLSGVTAGDLSGVSVSTAGDVNGDGFDDVIVGARGADPNGPYSGASYVIFGRADFSATAGDLNLSSLNGANGFRVSGVAARDFAGAAVSAAGDVNRDGFDDVLIGAWSSGASYLVFGRANFSATAGNLDLASLDGANGVRLNGAGSSLAVSGAGDINGDGFDDLIIGQSGGRPNGVPDAGASYVVFGMPAGKTVPTLNINDASGSEGETNTATFNVTLSAASTQTVTVQYATANGTATAPDDYTALGVTTLTFAPGETSKPVTVTVRGDSLAEENETFSVVLSNPSNAPIADGTGIGAIVDDDDAAVFELSRLNGTNGFRVDGLEAFSYTGRSVSDAGDVNGDGFDDVVINARPSGRYENREFPGGTYVIFGRADFSATTGDLDLASLNGTNGFRVNGVAAGNFIGESVSAAGDLNGDGYDDVIIGAPSANATGYSSGASYVIFGRADFSANGGNLSFATLNGTNGFRLSGVTAGDYSGSSVSAAGDVNGDGFDDVIVGARGADPNGEKSGASYVVFGRANFSATSGELNLGSLDGGNGFRLAGVAAGHYSGGSVSGAGDVNGDGFADVVIGAAGADPNGDNSGASYVVFGRADFSGTAGRVNLSSLNGANGFRVTGTAANERLGSSVSASGDVNRDGFDDVIIGVPIAGPNGPGSGASCVVFGRADFSATGGTLNLASLNGTNGFRLNGAAGELSGFSVSAAGDFNFDGFDDVIIGAPNAESDLTQFDAGASYVVFGGEDFSWTNGNLNLSNLSSGLGLRLNGVDRNDVSGRSVSAAGDVNGDGVDDVIVGAPHLGFARSPGYGAGYLVFGVPLVGGGLPTISISDVSVTEGNSGISPATFNVTLSEASTQTVTVQYATVNGTAFAPEDYTARALTTLTFAPGETSKPVVVTINGDTASELDETFSVALRNPSKATIADGTGLGTILNEDGPLPAISIADVFIKEGDSGTTTASFNVSLSVASTQPVTVRYATGDGTAFAPYDYVAVPLTTLTFAPGETSKPVVVTINGDTFDEPDETFTVNLSSPTNAIIIDGTGSGTILAEPVRLEVPISASGKRAWFPDVDGDLVTVKTSKGGFTQENFFVFREGAGARFGMLDLLQNRTGFQKAKLSISAETPMGGVGNGSVDLAHLNADRVDLGKVKLDGRLGKITAGDANLATPGLKLLKVGSLGKEEAAAGNAEEYRSEIAGALGALKVGTDVRSATLHVNGPIGTVAVGGSLIGGDGTGEAVVITAAGVSFPASQEASVAIQSVTINGGVSFARILAGYSAATLPVNADASIGTVLVNGDWRASSLVAGVADATGDGFGRNDTLIPGGSAEIIARIASVTINGTASGSMVGGDHFGITAGKVGRLSITGEKQPLSPGSADLLLDAVNNDFRAVDFA